MKLKTKYILLVCIILTGCQPKPELNVHSVESVKDFAIYCLKENDSIGFLKIFDLDSENFKISKHGNIELESMKKVILKSFNQAHQTLSNDIEFIKYDYLDSLEGGQIIDNSSFNVYVKSNGKYYKLRFPSYNENPIDTSTLFLFYFHDLTNECLNFETTPYIPRMLFKHELLWSFSEPNRFEEAFLRLNNLTSYSIREIKYRIRVKDKISGFTVLNKTSYSNVSIQSGDIGVMEIAPLKDVYMSSKLDTDKNFELSVEFLDITPKPINNPCNKIDVLENQKSDDK